LKYGSIDIFKIKNYEFEVYNKKIPMMKFTRITGNLVLLDIPVFFEGVYLKKKQTEIVVYGELTDNVNLVTTIIKFISPAFKMPNSMDIVI